MTTIVVDAIAGVMCSDSQWTDGTEKGPMRKVWRIGDALVGVSGDVLGIEVSLRWLRGSRTSTPPAQATAVVIWLAGRLSGGAVGGLGALGGACGGDTIGSALHTGQSAARGEADALAHAAHKVLVSAAAGEEQAGRAARAGTAIFVAERGSGSKAQQGPHCTALLMPMQPSQPCPLRAACPPTHVRRPVSRM